MRQVPLVIKGLTAAGYLSAADERGELYELHPDGNRYGFSVPRPSAYKVRPFCMSP